MPDYLEFATADHHHGQRLDKVLVQHCPHISRNHLQKMISAGCLQIDGSIVTNPSYQVKPHQNLSLQVLPQQQMPSPRPIPLAIVYEDEHLLVLNKPAGLAVHPTAGSTADTIVNGLLHYLGDNISNYAGDERPGIVHRLDRGTSGLMVAAKHNDCHQLLSQMLQQHLVQRTYLALVYGKPPAIGSVSGYMMRNPRNRTAMRMAEEGKWSVTNYRLQQTWGCGAISQLRCNLETGRTHQIRLHLNHIKHPVVGDPIYGRSRNYSLQILSPVLQQALRNFNRQALHAVELAFMHPITETPLKFSAAPPSDLQGILDLLAKEEV